MWMKYSASAASDPLSTSSSFPGTVADGMRLSQETYAAEAMPRGDAAGSVRHDEGFVEENRRAVANLLIDAGATLGAFCVELADAVGNDLLVQRLRPLMNASASASAVYGLMNLISLRAR